MARSDTTLHTELVNAVLILSVLLAGCGSDSGAPTAPNGPGAAPTTHAFFAMFEQEPLVDTRAHACPPWPASSDVLLTSAAKKSYFLLDFDTNSQYYGVTGLMAVGSWTSKGIDKVNPGTMFLFPGTTHSGAQWNGKLPTLLGTEFKPMVRSEGNDPLHKKLAEMICGFATDSNCLGTRSFVGFSAWSGTNEPIIRINSGQCNPYWFGGRKLGKCDGHDWSLLVRHALNVQLKSGP